MPLSNEDSLRLNVLCAQKVKAIRINDSSMVLSALTQRGEARFELTPNEQHELYLREVRNFLSERYLGMPGGYPRHLQRWSRMGYGHTAMDKMLLLGDEEAVVALAYSNRLDAEMAAHAWWAYQSPEIARNLLKNQSVASSELGPELAQFLLEFLPFEGKPLDIVDSVKQCLQGKLISEKDKAKLWERARRKNPYFVGFMLAGAQSIPLKVSHHSSFEEVSSLLSEALATANPFASAHLHFLTPEGRKWLKSLQLALKKPAEPDVVIALFTAIDQYIDLGIAEKRGVKSIRLASNQADRLCDTREAAESLQSVYLRLDASQKERFKALLVLAQLGDNTLNDVFAGRDATGTVMRKHLKPLIDPLNKVINILLS